MNISPVKSWIYKGPGFKNNSYTENDFIKNTPPPEETEIVNEVVTELQKNGSQINKNEILHSVGRIFEKAGALDVAKKFYECMNSETNLNKKQKDDIAFDLKRVYEKESEISEKSWEA